MQLIDKFTDYEIKLEDQVPVEDKTFCDKEQLLFNNALAQLSVAEALCRQQYNLQNTENKLLKLHEEKELTMSHWYPMMSRPSQSAESAEAVYMRCHFGWGYAIRDIERLRRELQQTFRTRIVNHFIKKYLLELPKELSEVNKYNLDIQWIDIVEQIRDALGGVLDFKGGAVEQAVENFRDQFQYRKPLLKGAIIEFDQYFWYSRRGGDTDFTEYRYGKETRKMDAAISVFELEEVRADYAITYMLGKKLSYDWEAPLNGEKLEAFKFFKNGKFHLRFKDGLLAKQFINRFGLNTVNT